MAEQVENSQIEGTTVDQNQNSVEATIESDAQGGAEAGSINLSSNAESSSVKPDSEREKDLEHAEELLERGSKAAKEQDYGEAIDCFSRALEIRVKHFGELAPECVRAYYKYGCALLYKAQEEADPLGTVPKKDGELQRDSDKDGSVRSTATVESATTSVASNVDESGCSSDQGKEKAPSIEPDAEGKEVEENEEESDGEDLAEGDEDESDLDLAWKMLDIARAIVERCSGDTMEKVDILSALAEVALEREDVETSLSDYLKALSILERLVEPDSRYLAELNFRICLCLEIGSKPQEAMPYCQKALSLCKSRVDRLTSEVKNSSGLSENAAESERDQTLQQSSSTTNSLVSAAEKEAEIETLTGLSVELEKKLEDLQQLVSNPKSFLSDILAMAAAKARGTEKPAASVAMSSSQIGTVASTGGFDSPTISTAHTNGTSEVTHLGVVGRGVKRVLMNSNSAESNPAKKPSTEPSPNNGGSSAS
ncbi:hypothetical protein M9H77_15711 [Catharanthus roseus]|uniref:Uncharacterized protein n=1 Tax=Catharanthus roseus TaxID=4058 RepID=A0ACC0B125_CATRO|nr:hypothetical protein M9H77_15711 [Catharanthus roseus]